jgi:hypothetical protein
MRTSLYSILCIVVRLGAVWLAVGLIAGLPATLDLLRSTEPAGAGGVLFAQAIGLLFAAALWLYPGMLARVAAGRSSQQVFESPIAAADLQAIALAVLGVAFAVSGVTGLVLHAAHYAWMTSLSTFTSASDRGLFSIVADAIQIVLGVALALGARGLSKVLLRLRDRGPVVAAETEERP